MFNISDNTNKRSLSNRYRSRRFLFFMSLINRIPKPLRILDIGGTQSYWEMMEFSNPDVKVTLLNLYPQKVTGNQFESIEGNATSLVSFPDKSVDVVHSNSVIEHLFTKETQQLMADEVRRVAKNYFIQTPNYYFPIEPHWVFPFFQFLPFYVRVWLTRHWRLGHIPRIADKHQAEQQVGEIRLLTKKEMQALFPEAHIYEEKFLFFTKSFTAYYFPGDDGQR